MQRPYIRPYAYSILLLLLFHYYHHYKTVATDKPLRTSLFSGAAELITHLLRLINTLWVPLCRINKFGFYFPRRLLRSPILVGHHRARPGLLPEVGEESDGWDLASERERERGVRTISVRARVGHGLKSRLGQIVSPAAFSLFLYTFFLFLKFGFIS
jgi:hypothetical protein